MRCKFLRQPLPFSLLKKVALASTMPNHASRESAPALPSFRSPFLFPVPYLAFMHFNYYGNMRQRVFRKKRHGQQISDLNQAANIEGAAAEPSDFRDKCSFTKELSLKCLPLKGCPICLSDFPSSQAETSEAGHFIKTNGGCSHSVCIKCMRSWIEVQMHRKKLPIRCPICLGGIVEDTEVRTIFNGEELATYLTIQCLVADGYIQPDEREIEADMRNDLEVHGFRTCPGCGVAVQKEGMLDNVRCRCGTCFCFKCGESLGGGGYIRLLFHQHFCKSMNTIGRQPIFFIYLCSFCTVANGKTMEIHRGYQHFRFCSFWVHVRLWSFLLLSINTIIANLGEAAICRFQQCNVPNLCAVGIPEISQGWWKRDRYIQIDRFQNGARSFMPLLIYLRTCKLALLFKNNEQINSVPIDRSRTDLRGMHSFHRATSSTTPSRCFSRYLIGHHKNDTSSIDDLIIPSSEIFEKVAPSIVFIDTFKIEADDSTLIKRQVPCGTGTGFIFDSSGHIITNYHVIDSAVNTAITFIDISDGNQTRVKQKASIIGVDRDYDVAVLRIEKTSPSKTSQFSAKIGHKNGFGQNHEESYKKIVLRPIERGSSEILKVGQPVLAVGNPYGLQRSLSVGVISGLDRDMRAPSGRCLPNLIQTDAAINPGNSGGPLLDSRGRIIGMNTAIKSPSGGSSGIGFAIPINLVYSVAESLIAKGKVEKGRLGLTFLRKDDDLRRQFAICDQNLPAGVLVLNANNDSHANKATIHSTFRNETSGDIILGDFLYEIDNIKVSHLRDISRILLKHKSGDIVNLKVQRALPRLASGIIEESHLSTSRIPLSNGMHWDYLNIQT
ncbi:putative Protease Do-like 1, chloroplastic [Cardiosporidium cionae]|uniref:Protease Do-like 1, chloroplastic n=1 Tax=Cardiosporidium cionae TaxID=476202 RepID=A0ABQ7JA62_9APIC|nr:putative Protease Do-like 1, chloroplastic [Cardiosporidium cionae]|eukprot:KAF8820882.1 putative Protease Do-like 1, chloroplastic [Cardiosporidium cionae]